MKLKYYLRGLGIGIIVTALVMGVGGNGQAAKKNPIESEDSKDILALEEKNNETDNNVYLLEQKQETEEPMTIDGGIEVITGEGSVESEVTEEYVTQPESVSVQNVVAEEIETNYKEETSSVQEDIIEEELPKEVQELLNQNEVFSFEVVRGDDSATVARKLFNAGFIDNAKQFDAFLTQHGYDKKIKVGVKKIPKGSTWMEIAQKLAGN